jgi:hypothetical protein
MGQSERKWEGHAKDSQEERSAQQSGGSSQNCSGCQGQVGESEGGGKEDTVKKEGLQYKINPT